MKIPLHNSMLQQAKLSFACRRVKLEQAKTLVREPYTPKAGDVVLAKIQELGQHKRIELANGRRAALSEGDLVILAYGNRYAPDQFEGLLPTDLSPCNMVAAGGIAANEIARNERIEFATQIQPLGVLADDKGTALNLMNFRLTKPEKTTQHPPLIVVAGTSMNAGKTHAAASLIRGLSEAGLKVGATKLTGTGAGGDVWRMVDSGASSVLDFGDAGLASTYLSSKESILNTAELLLDTLAAQGMDVIVAEIADGVAQSETCDLLNSSLIKSRASGVVFTAGDAMGASAGYQWLTDHKLQVLAISGLLSTSPLALRELSTLVPVPGLTSEQLSTPLDLSLVLPEAIFNHRVDKDINTEKIALPAHVINKITPAITPVSNAAKPVAAS